MMNDEFTSKDAAVSLHDITVADALLRAAKPARDTLAEAALVDRIVAMAERTPRLAAGQPLDVIPPPPMRTASSTNIAFTPDAPHRSSPGLPERLTGERPAAASGIFTRRRSSTVAAPSRWRTSSGAAGLMAASLLVGFLLGQSPSGDDAMRGFEAATGLSVASVSLDTIAAEISEE